MRVGLIVAVAAVLAGCVAYEPKPMDVHGSAADFSARSLDAAQAHEEIARLLPSAAQNWPPQQWNRAQLLALALVTNAKIALARAQVNAALAHEITAGQTPNPELTLQSEYARHDPHPWLYGIGLDFLVRSAGIRDLDVQLAQLETQHARWELLDQIWSVRHALISALSDREAARRRIATLDRLASAQDHLVSMAEKRVAAGEDSSIDLLLVRQAQLDITQQQADARLAVSNAQAALAAALGMPQSALETLQADWHDWGEPADVDAHALQTAREQALLSRSDLSSAIGDYAQTEAKLHQAVLRQYPQFHLSPGYYWDHGVAKFPFDIGFTLPLFNRSQGEIAEARAARDVAGARMISVQADIISQLDAAQNSERIARENVGIATRQFEFGRKQQHDAQIGAQLGAIAADEQIRTDVIALRSELELLQTRAQWQSARNGVEDAMRAPLSGPELQMQQSMTIEATGAHR
jgi:outer membrane protein, heavy metal efflux system